MVDRYAHPVLAGVTQNAAIGQQRLELTIKGRAVAGDICRRLGQIAHIFSVHQATTLQVAAKPESFAGVELKG